MERIKMPLRSYGKRVADRYLCDSGHLHMSPALAVRCNQLRRAKEAKAKR